MYSEDEGGGGSVGGGGGGGSVGGGVEVLAKSSQRFTTPTMGSPNVPFEQCTPLLKVRETNELLAP